MARLAEVEGRISSMEQLLDIVGAMRSMAAMRMQQAHRALPGIRRYTAQVASGLASSSAILGAAPEARRSPSRRAVVVIASEHGFVSAYNDKLIDAFEQQRRPDDALFCVGTRGAMMLAERGVKPDWTCPMVTRCAGATDSVHRLTTELYQYLSRGEVSSVELIHSDCGPSGTAAILTRQRLVPVDLAAFVGMAPPRAPIFTMSATDLYERLVAEYLFARLTQGVVEAIGSENATRLAAMQSARENVLEKLDDLQRVASQLRQGEITNELLELVTGAAAQSSRGTQRRDRASSTPASATDAQSQAHERTPENAR